MSEQEVGTFPCECDGEPLITTNKALIKIYPYLKNGCYRCGGTLLK